MVMDFNNLVKLWKKYNESSNKLITAMGRTKNSVGEFAEELVQQYYINKGFKATLLTPSNIGADLELNDGKQIQIKARKMEKVHATQLSDIRHWNFDYLVVVIFDMDGNVARAIEIPKNDAQKISKQKKSSNCFILTTSNALLNHKNAKDIRGDLQNILDA